MALMPLDPVLHSHLTMQFHLHSAIEYSLTASPLHHTLSPVCTRIPCYTLTVLPWDGFPTICWMLAVSPGEDFLTICWMLAVSPWGHCPYTSEHWSYVALSLFSILPHSSRQCYLSLSLEATRRIWWSVPLTRRHWHSGSSDVRGSTGCILLGTAASRYSSFGN
jgi:hypothetical protein